MIGSGLDLLYLLIFTLVGIGFVVSTIAMSSLVRPSDPTPEKLTSYECGNLPEGESWVQFRLRYYVFAILLVVFDIQVVFLYLWAVVARQIGLAGLIQVGLFTAVLLLGMAYAWRKGALKWT